MSEPAFRTRPWDTALPDAFSLEQYISGVIDMAINLTGAYTADGYGLAHEVLTAAEFLILFGVLPAPLGMPADFAGTAANMRNQQRAHDWYAMQTKFMAVLRSAFIAGLPERILRLIEVNGSTRHHIHVSDMITDLRAKLQLTRKDLDMCKEQISKPYQRGALIRPFIADQLRFLGYLSAGGQGLANGDAVDLLKSAFTSTRVDKADFSPAISEYLKDHGGMAAQTPASWCAFITKFVDERLDHHAETNSAARRGIANAAVEDEQTILASMSGPLAVEFQAFMAEKNKPKEPPRRSKRKASEVSSKAPGNSAPRQLPSGPKPGDPLYCWSHGKGHASGGTVNPCRNPKEGHIYSADFRNQQDGVPAYL
jgi:hypothetical protein